LDRKLASGPEQEKKRKVKKEKEKWSGLAAGLTLPEMEKRRGRGNWAARRRDGLRKREEGGLHVGEKKEEGWAGARQLAQ
jgi:hypothetical protein